MYSVTWLGIYYIFALHDAHTTEIFLEVVNDPLCELLRSESWTILLTRHTFHSMWADNDFGNQ